MCSKWIVVYFQLFPGGLILNTNNEFGKHILKDVYFKSIHLLLKVFQVPVGLVCSDATPAELVKKNLAVSSIPMEVKNFSANILITEP